MSTYYKATQIDGTDFHTGTVDYAGHLESGKPLKRKPALAEYRTCSDTVYHASDTPSETLIGEEWPCRLFEVTGSPVAAEDHKHGFRSLRVVKELPAWMALGPNGQEVVALVERCKSLTRTEIDALHAAWGAARHAALYAARDAAWDAARRAAWGAARHAALYAARDAALYAARRAAWDAAWDAVSALVVRDLITPEQFDLLYGPWASVITS